MYQIVACRGKESSSVEDFKGAIEQRQVELIDQLQIMKKKLTEYLSSTIYPEPLITQDGRKNIRLIVLGKTGSGKTTFIKSLYAYCLKLTLGDVRLAQVNKDFQGDNLNHNEQYGSQTSESAIYTFENDQYKIAIIDTPGFGDTDISKEEENMMNIFNGILQAQSFSIICLVYPLPNCRLDLGCKYTLAQLKQIVPKAYYDRIYICMTYGIGDASEALNTLNTMNVPSTHFYKFESSCVFAEPDDEISQICFEYNNDSIKKFLEDASSNSPIQVYDFAMLAYYHMKYFTFLLYEFKYLGVYSTIRKIPLKDEPMQKINQLAQRESLIFEIKSNIISLLDIVRGRSVLLESSFNKERVEYLKIMKDQVEGEQTSPFKIKKLEVLAQVINLEDLLIKKLYQI